MADEEDLEESGNDEEEALYIVSFASDLKGLSITHMATIDTAKTAVSSLHARRRLGW